MASDESKSTGTDRGFVMVEDSSEAGGEPNPEGLPKIDFATFAISLGTSALFHMGLVEDPSSGERIEQPNLTLARQTVDTLEMLEAKTRGNLDDEEKKLLDSLLYEIRLRFIEAKQ